MSNHRLLVESPDLDQSNPGSNPSSTLFLQVTIRTKTCPSRRKRFF